MDTLDIIELNGSVITHNTIKFSGGEVQLKLLPELIKSTNEIKAHIVSSDGIMLLAQLAYVLNGKVNNLLLPYVPYSRYDRSESQSDPLSLKVFCTFINSLGFNRVVTHDNHSDVATALLDNCINIPQHVLVKQLFERREFIEQNLHDILKSDLQQYDAIVSPDSSASKKAFEVCKLLQIPLIECYKHRDFSTGEIVNISVPTQQLIDGNYKNVLIVDDICDGGRTFIGLSDELLRYVDEVDLYVTHGIFSKGTKQICKNIRSIYTCHNWLTISSDNFMQHYKP